MCDIEAISVVSEMADPFDGFESNSDEDSRRNEEKKETGVNDQLVIKSIR